MSPGVGAPPTVANAVMAVSAAYSHPATGEDVRWTSAPPPDFDGVMKRLR